MGQWPLNMWIAAAALVGASLGTAAAPPAAPSGASSAVPPAAPPSPDAPQEEPRGPAAAERGESALARLSPEARSKASRRARAVYRMPDGTVWDNWWYGEFRDALKGFDALPKGAQPTVRQRAWGFKAGERRIAKEEERPHPLWHTLAPGPYYRTPFFYINTEHTTDADKGHGVMARIEREVADQWFVVYVQEFPKSEIGRLPYSFGSFGSVRISVFVPREVTARVGGELEGEFFLVVDKELRRPKAAPTTSWTCRYVHAAKLRLNAEQYAAALLAGEVEMIEWSFVRKIDRLGEKFEWTRRVVEARGEGAGQSAGEGAGDGGEAGKPGEEREEEAKREEEGAE